MFPDKIKELIKDLKIKEYKDFHVSKDLVYNISNKYILKISDNISRLEEEYHKDLWISSYLNCINPLLFITEQNKAYYLREYIDGEILCLDKYLNNPLHLIDLLVEGINILHNIKVNDERYLINEGYNTLIHGDYCLPNILVKNDKVVGFIDLGQSGIGDPWNDYAWCIWSLECNLKTNKYTNILLDKLGIKFDQEKFDKYTK